MAFKKTIFYNTYSSITEDLESFAYILGLHLAMFMSFLLFSFLLNKYLPVYLDNLLLRLGTNKILITTAVIGVYLIYMALSVLLYTVFMYFVIHHIKAFGKHKNRHEFGKLYFVNLFLVITFLALIFLFGPLILQFMLNKSTFLAIFLSMIIIAFFLMLYLLYGFMYAHYVHGHTLGDNIKQSFKHIFSKKHFGIILFSILAIVAYVIIYVALAYLFRTPIANNYDTFATIATYTSIFYLSVLISFNTVYFYKIVTTHKKKSKVE